MSRRMLLIVVLVCGIAAAVAVAIAVRGAHGSSRADLFRFSTRGRRITPSNGATHAFGVQSGRLLAVRDGRAFYRLDTADGLCFGVGSAASLGDPGGEVCPRDPFPSSARPVLDFSVYEGRTASRDDLTIYRIEGFAADGVAAIGIRNRAGHVALRVAVADNVYVLSHVPPGLSGSVVALDSGGAVISGPDH